MPGTGGDFSHDTVVPLYQTRSRLPALVAFYICASFIPLRSGFISLAGWLMMAYSSAGREQPAP